MFALPVPHLPFSQGATRIELSSSMRKAATKASGWSSIRWCCDASSSGTRMRALLLASGPRERVCVERDDDAPHRRAGLRDAGAEGYDPARRHLVVRDVEGPGLQLALLAVLQDDLEFRQLARNLGDVHHFALDDQRLEAVLHIATRREFLNFELARRWWSGDAEQVVILRRRRPIGDHLVARPPQPAAEEPEQHQEIEHPQQRRQPALASRQRRELHAARGLMLDHGLGRGELDATRRLLLLRQLVPGMRAAGAAHQPSGGADRARIDDIAGGAHRTGYDHRVPAPLFCPYRGRKWSRQESRRLWDASGRRPAHRAMVRQAGTES